MQRFYVTFPLKIDLEITDADIHHQLTRVMRVSMGESIVLFDGDGSETEYEIIHITKKSLSLRGKGRRFPKTENTKQVTLYQALPNKMEKIEYILEK
jgi:RsmE family RNA methyltransferase